MVIRRRRIIFLLVQRPQSVPQALDRPAAATAASNAPGYSRAGPSAVAATGTDGRCQNQRLVRTGLRLRALKSRGGLWSV